MEPDTPSSQQCCGWSQIAKRRKTKLSYFGSIMPLLRYFTFVGGALLALLIVVSSFLPETETIARPEAARPIIQIASDRVGPPPVNIDTRVQIAVVPASVPEILQNAPARVAEGELSALPTPVLPARIERKKTKIAKRPDRQRMAANRQGFQPSHLTW